MKISIILPILTFFLSTALFADSSYPTDSTKQEPPKPIGGGTYVQGTAGGWIATGSGSGSECTGETTLIDTADLENGPIAACPRGTKGELSSSARGHYYMPAENDWYNNGWRAAQGSAPLCINKDGNYTLNICAYVGYNNGSDQACGPVFMQYSINCVAQEDKKYKDPSCPVSTEDLCPYTTDVPQKNPPGIDVID